MAQASALLVSLTLFTIMFALGLGLRSEALAQIRHRPALVIRVLIGSCVLVPLVALLLLKLPLSFALSPTARFGIALMAVCPSAPLTLRKAGKTGGDRQLAALLQACAAVAAIVSIPLLADLYRASFGIDGWNIGPREVALQVGKAQVLPLLAGLLLRRWRPGWVARLEGPLDKIANGLFLLLIVVVLVKVGPLLLPFAATNGLALGFMAVMVAAALAIGFLLAGPTPQERTTVALVTSMRNPGLALLFASTYGGSSMPGLKLAVLAYLLVTVLVSIPFLKWQKSRLVQA
ncbi:MULTISPECIES: bile acid:sodium symporter [unclassified Synechococcus]|uniref:bile acid:sodium symporter n=1 Tax=unclassified Synechococcus TaxID=2626047 RepID=UPI0021A54CEE|nr:MULTISPECIES: bile acid:sodium symporter [unclassified Synechococcus]MCT0213342.1 bile acid:sodium symporter [Synechococcus sp. CS-1326]MCT0232804.1 bile acid:sodium symporter [Synechococcus sp. CS-1327]